MPRSPTAATPFVPTRRPAWRRPMAGLMALLLLAGCVTTRAARIGEDDGDACRAQLVALDSTGDFFAEDILRGAAMGAAGGAALGALFAAATGQRGSGIATGAAIGAVGGGLAGGTAGYLAARRQQAADQATLDGAIAGDLAAENAQMDRTQRAFDQLMECRLGQAARIRADLRDGRVARPQAEAAMASLRASTQRDIQLAQTINGRILRRGAEFDTAIETVAPGANQAAAQPAPAVAAAARGPVKLRLRPEADAPEVVSLAPREDVTLRPARNGYARVQTAGGLRGYAPASAFPEARALPPAAVEQPGDVRSLAASNIARRDDFAASIGTAERLTQGQGFEMAS
ncbi:hypothetical protein [Falsiroseomonas selenitidurans]|uniref:Glycine zipper domain-containing protein n=1 Tax=Falsiroseomonas selenitidurans TaxID=2716335 RepID=A0ABX1EA41_9PROT|nr:hypothetical protein [Falsiroseomonas selenitidurans]NKC34109.1 hypothetical protein [Falsiroseomonas selenitidurans]